MQKTTTGSDKIKAIGFQIDMCYVENDNEESITFHISKVDEPTVFDHSSNVIDRTENGYMRDTIENRTRIMNVFVYWFPCSGIELKKGPHHTVRILLTAPKRDLHIPIEYHTPEQNGVTYIP